MLALVIHLTGETRQQLATIQKKLKLTCVSDVIETVIANYCAKEEQERVENENTPD